MTIYVEYALLENFLIDGMLLYLSLRGAKANFKWKKLLFSAFVGAIFALLSPFIALPDFLSYLLKFLMGILLCLLAFPPLKNKNDVGRYAISLALFFLLSFAFAGAIFALYDHFSFLDGSYQTEQTPATLVLVCAIAFLIFTVRLGKSIYKKQTIFRNVYDCAILYGKRRVAILGFFDSGNLATKKGAPVCFLSPEIAFDIWECALLSPHGEITVQTLGGEKTLPLFVGDLEIKKDGSLFIKKGVYFAPSAHMVSREYKLLLQANIFN